MVEGISSTNLTIGFPLIIVLAPVELSFNKEWRSETGAGDRGGYQGEKTGGNVQEPGGRSTKRDAQRNQ